MDFLQKPSSWFSKFYLSVQSKNCGRNIFLIFLFRFFSDFSSKNFSDFRPKNFKKLSKLPSACPEEQFVLEIFFKSFEALLTFCRNLWHGSQVSIYVSTAKIAKKQFSYFSFQNFFRNLSEKFFRLSAKELQKVVKTTFCVSEGTICGSKYFLKVLKRNGFSAETFGIVLKFIYTCPE